MHFTYLTLSVCALFVNIIIDATTDIYKKANDIYPPIARTILICAFPFTMAVLEVFGFTYYDVIAAVVEKPFGFLVLLLGLALLQLLMGLMHAAYVILRYRSAHGWIPLTWEERRMIAQHGGLDQPVEGKGVFCICGDHVFLGTICNVYGALSAFFMALMIHNVEPMHLFILNHAVVVNVLQLLPSAIVPWVILPFVYNQQHLGRPEHAKSVQENQDDYLLSRPHQIVNTIFLVVAYSVVLTLLVCSTCVWLSSRYCSILGYEYIGLIASVLAWLWMIGPSKCAEQYKSVARESSKTGIVTVIAIADVVGILGFKPSIWSFALIAMTLLYSINYAKRSGVSPIGGRFTPLNFVFGILSLVLMVQILPLR